MSYKKSEATRKKILDAARARFADKGILGMVGNGALRNTMLLSQEALRRGFGEQQGVRRVHHCRWQADSEEVLR